MPSIARLIRPDSAAKGSATGMLTYGSTVEVQARWQGAATGPGAEWDLSVR